MYAHGLSKTEYMRRWRKNNRDRLNRCCRKTEEKKRATIRRAKDGPCSDCGKRLPYYVMQFDHVRGRKNFILARGYKRSFAAIEKEIKKCDLVCSNCHAARTWRRRGRSTNSGTR